MKNLFFPTTIVDGFFENPDLIRKIALNEKFDFKLNNYPGKKSRPINEISQLLYNTIIYKFTDLFFERKHNVAVSADMRFQLINEEYENGWVHRDDGVATAIIYLTPENKNKSIGTSLYDKRNILDDPNTYEPNNIDIPENKERFLQVKKYTDAKKTHNEKYKEVLNVSGLYNRGLLFDSHLYHAAHNFIGKDDTNSRLTIVICFYEILSTHSRPPIERIHRNALTII